MLVLEGALRLSVSRCFVLLIEVELKLSPKRQHSAAPKATSISGLKHRQTSVEDLAAKNFCIAKRCGDCGWRAMEAVQSHVRYLVADWR